jgi:hypothetical protein
MAVRVHVLGHPWVLDPMSAGSSSFLHPWIEPAPNPHRIGFGIYFSPVGVSETRKNPKNPQNLKK